MPQGRYFTASIVVWFISRLAQHNALIDLSKSQLFVQTLSGRVLQHGLRFGQAHAGCLQVPDGFHDEERSQSAALHGLGDFDIAESGGCGTPHPAEWFDGPQRQATARRAALTRQQL